MLTAGDSIHLTQATAGKGVTPLPARHGARFISGSWLATGRGTLVRVAACPTPSALRLAVVADTEKWLERIAGIRRWQRRGARAPHKPLLLLYCLGRLQRTGSTRVSYAEAEPSLKSLLHEYGPARATTPAYPFHHLQTDELWVVETQDGSVPGASPGRLRSSGAVGRLAPDFEQALRREPCLAPLVARTLLDANFPDSLHADICEAVGLDLEGMEVDAARARAAKLRARKPEFRQVVLMAYERRCAMCGYDGQLESAAVGLDAAHLRWWAFDGPDEVANALCLCTLHHKLLDRGALGSSPTEPSPCRRTSSRAAAPVKSSCSPWRVGRSFRRRQGRTRPQRSTSPGTRSRSSALLRGSCSDDVPRGDERSPAHAHDGFVAWTGWASWRGGCTSSW